MPKDRAKAFGFIGIAFGVGFMLGPAISGLLAGYGHRYPIFLAAGLSAVSVLCTRFLLGASTPRKTSSPSGGLEWRLYAEFFRSPKLSKLIAQFFLFIFSFSVFVGGLALFCERRYTRGNAPFGVREVGLVFAYSGLVGIVVQGGLIGRLLKLFGEKRLVVAGFVSMAAGFVVLGGSHSTALLMLAITVFSLGHSLLRPCITSLFTQNVSREHQGAALGLLQSIMSMTQVAGPLVGGLLIENRLLPQWAWLGAAFCAGGFFLTLLP